MDICTPISNQNSPIHTTVIIQIADPRDLYSLRLEGKEILIAQSTWPVWFECRISSPSVHTRPLLFEQEEVKSSLKQHDLSHSVALVFDN